MREILFRGKRISNSKWVEGFMYSQHFPLEFRDDFYIRCYYTDYLVLPETVGQYTGLTDKNGVKIFEGDIIRFKDNIGYVIYTDDDASFLVDSQNRYIAMDYSSEFEVIGDIHDNPELLKVGDNNE